MRAWALCWSLLCAVDGWGGRRRSNKHHAEEVLIEEGRPETARPFAPDARRGRKILAGENSRSCGQFSASRVERAPEVLPARCAHWTPSRYERAAR